MQNKFLSLLGMARRANRLSLGFEAAQKSVLTHRCKALFCASDLSEKTKERLDRSAEENGAELIVLPYTMFDITCAVGQSCGIVSVIDKGFADGLLKQL